MEDHRFSQKPSREYLEVADKMHQGGIPDLDADDLSKLWENRSRIREERQAIEKTLQEIRTRMKGRIEEDKNPT